jgi:hypothetical protein
MINRRTRTSLSLGLALATLSLAACDRPHEPNISVADARKSATDTIRRSLVDDPSLPSASQALAQDAQAQASGNSNGHDTRANDPAGTLTKQEEKNEMPKGGQVNNYNSPAFEGGSKR